MIYDPNLSFSVQRLRDLGRALEGAMELDLPRVLEALEQARKGTPEALHEEAATYAARAVKAEQRIETLKVELSIERRKVESAQAEARLAQHDELLRRQLAEKFTGGGPAVVLDAINRMHALPRLVARILPAVVSLDPEGSVRALMDSYILQGEELRKLRGELKAAQQDGDRATQDAAELVEVQKRLAEANALLAKERARNAQRQGLLDRRRGELRELRQLVDQQRVELEQLRPEVTS